MGKEKKKKKNNLNIIRVFVTIIFMILLIFAVIIATNILNRQTNTFVVTNGSLSYEETADGYILRDEIILQGENYKNGMVQVVSDGKKVAKNQIVFRYYSNGEERIQGRIAALDEEINQVLGNGKSNIFSTDIVSLENQIQDTIDLMYNINNIQKMEEYKKRIETYISKKAKITGDLSPSDSYVKTLITSRDELENELQSGSEIVVSPRAGIVTYRVDGLEEILKVDNFDYLSKELLDGFELNTGSVIPINTEKGKVVDNFNYYIITSINTEKALSAKVGDKVTLRLSTSDEIPAEIVYIVEENEENRIIVFSAKKETKELLEYRKVSLDIIWWNYSGLKISNSAIIQEDDKTYVERNRAGTTERILIKVSRQNDTYSIVENYSDDDLKEIYGYTEEEIANRYQIKLYDEILLH